LTAKKRAVEVMDTYKGELDPWRPYLISGTPEQMLAIAGLDTVIAAEIPEDLDTPIPVELAAKLDAVLVPLGQPAVPEGMSYLEAFNAAKLMFGNGYPLDSYSVAG
jgi:hypothetical protein